MCGRTCRRSGRDMLAAPLTFRSHSLSPSGKRVFQPTGGGPTLGAENSLLKTKAQTPKVACTDHLAPFTCFLKPVPQRARMEETMARTEPYGLPTRNMKPCNLYCNRFDAWAPCWVPYSFVHVGVDFDVLAHGSCNCRVHSGYTRFPDQGPCSGPMVLYSKVDPIWLKVAYGWISKT